MALNAESNLSGIDEPREKVMTEKVMTEKIMVGYINVNESDDFTKLFEIMNEFRKTCGLKYTNQKNYGMVYFSVNSKHLDALSKVRPFRISKISTRSEYHCDADMAGELTKQKDSFIRMNWDEETSTLSFISRTLPKVHANLVRRIFNDAKMTMDKSQYSVLRDFRNKQSDEQETQETHETHDTHDTQEIQETLETQEVQVQETKEVQETLETQDTSDGFERVVARTKKPKGDKPEKATKSTKTRTSQSKVVKETDGEQVSKPRVRGSRVQKTTSAEVEVASKSVEQSA